ncbi:MAG: protein kinase domain-containing protein, partial [Pseudanabaena sp.]
FAHFEENNEFFLVEEFVDGHSLDQEIRVGQKLSEEATINLLLEILEVLAFVHQQNVIHRDIKLANLMRRRQDGKIVLIDFGAVKDISALETDSQGHTGVTVGIGSPGYMPSEQASGKPRLSSDVYAVGMIGLLALSGIAPDSFREDANTGEILWRDRVQVSSEFAEILQNMVFYHFGRRYKSAIEALQAVKSLALTNINNSASAKVHSINTDPTVAISLSPKEENPSSTIITGSPITGLPITNLESAKPPESPPTTPQTAPHSTIFAPLSSPTLRPFLWIGLMGFTAMFAAIVTVLLLPKFTNQDTATKPKPEVTASPTVSETPEPEVAEADIPEPPIVPSPDVPTGSTLVPSFGAIARSPSTQFKGYAWNYNTQQLAEVRAIKECESSGNSGDCQVMIWAKNSCISIAEGTNGEAGTGRSENSAIAESTAIKVCQNYQGINCTVSKTICLPFR